MKLPAKSVLVAVWLTLGPLVVGTWASAWVVLQGEVLVQHPSASALAACALLGLALLPTTAMALLSGYLLGWGGLVLCLVLYLPAASMGYGLGLALKPSETESWLAAYPKAAQVWARLQRGGWRTVFWLRLSPVVPFGIGNVLMAWGGIGYRSMLLGSLPGMLPRTALAVYGGHQARSLADALQSGTAGPELAFTIILFLAAGVGLYLQGKMSARADEK